MAASRIHSKHKTNSKNSFVAVGIILARGGSKGVPRKNIRMVAGKPLIAHTIETALASQRLNRVIVSTDDSEIAKVASRYGVQVPFLRPKHLAKDDTPDLPVLQHALRHLETKENYRCDIVVHLRPTYPLRQPRHIDEVVDLLIRSKADSVKTVREVDRHPHKMWSRNTEGWLKPYLNTSFRKKVGPDYPRQKLGDLYACYGVVDAVWRDVLIRKKSTTGSKVMGYFIDPMYTADIDLPYQLPVIEALFQYIQNNSKVAQP